MPNSNLFVIIFSSFFSLILCIFLLKLKRRIFVRKTTNAIIDSVLAGRRSINYLEHHTIDEIRKWFVEDIDKGRYSEAGTFVNYFEAEPEFLERQLSKCFSGDMGYEQTSLAASIISTLGRELTNQEYRKLIERDLREGYPAYALFRSWKSGHVLSCEDLEEGIEAKIKLVSKILDKTCSPPVPDPWYYLTTCSSENQLALFLLYISHNKWETCQLLLKEISIDLPSWKTFLLVSLASSRFRKDMWEYVVVRLWPGLYKKEMYLWIGR